MNKNINAAFDDVHRMVKDCNKRIEELEVLKEVYQVLGKGKDQESDLDNAVTETKHFVESTEKYNLPVRGVFYLAPNFKQLHQIDEEIKIYQEINAFWSDVLDKLGAS